MVSTSRFREDLFYRLNVIHMHLPPLREHMEDLSLLTEHLLAKINVRQHTAVKHLAENAWRRMKEYQWPGNIRELDNILTRAAVLARTDTITVDLLALPNELRNENLNTEATEGFPTLRLISLDEIEQEHVRAILEHTRWHKGKACEILGISRPALERKIAKYGLG